MKWTHQPETSKYHETWTAELARVYKDGDGKYRAMVWPQALTDGKNLGHFASAADARQRCEEFLMAKGLA